MDACKQGWFAGVDIWTNGDKEDRRHLARVLPGESSAETIKAAIDDKVNKLTASLWSLTKQFLTGELQ